MGGEPANGWKLVTLDELGEVNRGRSRHRPRYAEHLYGGPYPFVQTGDIKQSGGKITSYEQTYSEAGLAQSRLWPTGTMAITIAANIAETAILTFPACFPDSVVGFIADESKCDVRFIEYTFRNLKRQIQHEATGSVQDNINLGTLQRLHFPLPDISDQRSIASILGALDDKIELNRRMNETLESIARAIFKSWFVDFDPVRAKMDGRQPPGLPPNIAAQFPNSFEHLNGDLVPSGWKFTTIDKCTSLIIDYRGKTPKKLGSEWAVSGIPAVSAKNVKGGRLVRPDTFKFVDEELYGRWMKDELMLGDILMTSEAPLGELCFLAKNAKFCLSQRLYGIRANPAICYPSYLYYWLDSDDAQADLMSRATGTTVVGIRQTELRKVRVLIPPMDIQSAAASVCSAVQHKVHQNESESGTLAMIRNTLLPKLLSGEIRVADAERKVAEAI